jgi:hypothetical protein
MELLGERQAGLPKRLPSGRSHILLQFRGIPQEPQVLELQSRGAIVVGVVPECGLVVSANEGTRLDDLDLVDAGALRLENKVSADLNPQAGEFLVAFHPDVDAQEIHEVIRENRLEEHYHPDVLAHQALVYGSAASAMRLAEWDEVAYVFPASAALANGTRVYACAGPVTSNGPIGQYVASVGDGWDGAGQGSADLGYYLGALATRVPRLQAQSEILRALGEWSKYVKVNFLPAASPNALRTLSIFFARGAHGDAYPFDGSGRVLAHTFYPAPPNPESIAGDMHFDDDENWGIGQNTDVFSVALHEAGHALGLAHSDRPGDVMYPYYSPVTGLTANDVAAVRQLYAARDAAVEPPTPGTPPTPPAPKPVDPEPPSPPKPKNPPQPPQKPPATDTVAPSLRILSPPATTVATSATTIVMRGTATDNVGVVKVTWTDSIGTTGLAGGTSFWQTSAIPLRVGSNTITIRAFDAAGNSGWRAVVVTRR